MGFPPQLVLKSMRKELVGLVAPPEGKFPVLDLLREGMRDVPKGIEDAVILLRLLLELEPEI